MKFKGKRTYEVQSQMSGMCWGNDAYASIKRTNNLLVFIFLLIKHNHNYPQTIGIINGKYIECENCNYYDSCLHESEEEI